MAVSNNLQKAASEPRNIGSYLSQANIKTLLNNTLGSEKEVQKFISSLCSAVSTNPALQECEKGTLISSALLATTLNLSLSPQLGLCYIVPFEDRKNGRTVATFILGYKGYIQLAIRSGYYKKINVISIKEGELKRFNPLTEEIDVELIEDEEKRAATPTVGYYAMFEYLSGFQKAIYWSKKKMELHAKTYSKGYAAQKGFTFWEKDFDSMAYKTLIRQIISKWGIMSIDLQKAVENDNDEGTENNYFEDMAVQTARNPEVVTEQPVIITEENIQEDFFSESVK